MFLEYQKAFREAHSIKPEEVASESEETPKQQKANRNEYMRNYWKKHPEKIRDAQRRYREKNPEEFRQYMREYMRRYRAKKRAGKETGQA